MPDWVISILQSHGLAGVVIFALTGAVIYLSKDSKEVNRNRLEEHDVMIKALEGVAATNRDIVRSTDERNQVTRELADAISKLATAFEMMTQKVDFHQELVKDKLADQRLVIDALSESNRTNSGLLRDIRDRIFSAAVRSRG